MDVFLLALIPMVGLKFNNIVVIHILSSIGLSVLYTVLILHAYIVQELPEANFDISRAKQKVVKTRIAMSKIGSSVFHSSVASLIALLVVGLMHKSYIFEVFCKLWPGIVIVCMLNFYAILPIILSLFGPLADDKERKYKR